MGYMLFEESGTFNPALHGLKVGDSIVITAVGGGGGGAYSYHSDYFYNGGTGGTTIVGSIVSALGGAGGCYSDTHTPPEQGQYRGGMAKDCYLGWGGFFIAGGAGGYIPGTDDWGGNGGNAYEGGSSATGTFDIDCPIGSMGLGTIYPASALGKYRIGNNSPGLYYTEGSYSHIGYKPLKDGQGNGYGAGGGSVHDCDNENYPGTTFGGNSGEVKHAVHTLSSTDAIAITIGAGGAKGDTDAGSDGTSGCVEIFW